MKEHEQELKAEILRILVALSLDRWVRAGDLSSLLGGATWLEIDPALRRLEEEGLVEHRVSGPGSRWRATEAARQQAARDPGWRFDLDGAPEDTWVLTALASPDGLGWSKGIRTSAGWHDEDGELWYPTFPTLVAWAPAPLLPVEDETGGGA